MIPLTLYDICWTPNDDETKIKEYCGEANHTRDSERIFNEAFKYILELIQRQDIFKRTFNLVKSKKLTVKHAAYICGHTEEDYRDYIGIIYDFYPEKE